MNCVVVAISCLVVLATSQRAPLTLTKLSSGTDGVCLDGSPAAYYSSPRGQTGMFLIFFQGGGWCYSPNDCAYRAKTDLGSSNGWASNITVGGLLSDDATVNPFFNTFTRIFVPYCDGCSYAGNRAQPVQVGNQTIYYRGATILRRLLEEFDARFGFRHASDVLVSGCSAGGLTVFLHIDQIAEFVNPGARVAGVPGSGYFLNATTYGSNSFVYGNQMSMAWATHNASAGTNQHCVTVLNSPACVMAPYVLPFIRTPLFILNSVYDQWQMGNVVGAGVASFQKCASEGPVNCTTSELATANAFRVQLETQINAGIKPGDGWALNSCWTHCMPEQWGDYWWQRFSVSGAAVTVSQTVAAWYQQIGKPAQKWRQTDCVVSQTGAGNCNPSCPAPQVSSNIRLW